MAGNALLCNYDAVQCNCNAAVQSRDAAFEQLFCSTKQLCTKQKAQSTMIHFGAVEMHYASSHLADCSGTQVNVLYELNMYASGSCLLLILG